MPLPVRWPQRRGVYELEPPAYKPMAGPPGRTHTLPTSGGMSCTGCRPVSGELPGGQSPHLGSIKWPSEAVAPGPKKENAPKPRLAGPSARAPKLAGGPKVALLQYWGGVTMPVVTRRDGAFAFPYIGAAAAHKLAANIAACTVRCLFVAWVCTGLRLTVRYDPRHH